MSEVIKQSIAEYHEGVRPLFFRMTLGSDPENLEWKSFSVLRKINKTTLGILAWETYESAMSEKINMHSAPLIVKEIPRESFIRFVRSTKTKSKMTVLDADRNRENKKRTRPVDSTPES